MKELRVGKMTITELADWFGIQPNRLSRRKIDRLKELESYCSFKDLGKKGIEVLEVYYPVRMKDVSMKDVKLYKQLVEEQPDQITSVSAMIGELKEKEEYQGVKDNTLMKRLSKAGEIGFGKTKEKNSEGIYGERNYVWAIKLKGKVHYRRLTAEEDKIFNELISAVYASNPEKIKDAALLEEDFKNSNMTKEEYFERKELLGLNVFSGVLIKFREKTGYTLTKATKHDLNEAEKIHLLLQNATDLAGVS